MTNGNGQDAPKAAVRLHWVERLKPTHTGRPGFAPYPPSVARTLRSGRAQITDPQHTDRLLIGDHAVNNVSPSDAP